MPAESAGPREKAAVTGKGVITMARRLVVGLALVAAAGLAAGCGGSGGEDRRETAPEVVWAGRICDAVGQGAAGLKLPAFSDPEDAKAVKKEYLTFLGGLSAQLTTLEGRLRQAGAPPVPHGRDAWAKALANLQAAKTALGDATAEVRAAKTNDIDRFQASIAELDKMMKRYADYEGPIKDLRANPAMGLAFDRSQSCTSRNL